MTAASTPSRRAPDLPTLAAYVAWWARETPEAEAAVLAGRRLSYARLDAAVKALSGALLRAGVAAGDRVATLQTPHPDYLVTFLAATSIGAIWVGLNPRYRVEEIAHVLRDAAPKLLFTRSRIGGRDYAPDLAAALAAAPGVSRLVVFEGDPPFPGATPMAAFLADAAGALPAASDDPPAPVGGRAPCLIVYTSGSTGRPKGAVLSHSGVAAFARAQNRLWPLDPFSVLNYFPINHVGCVCDITAPTLVAGGRLVFLEQYDTAESLRLMQAERISLWASVPSVFQMQLAWPGFAAIDLSAVGLIVWEGAAAPADLLERLRAVHPALATNYGMTETTSAITAVTPTDDLEVLAGSVGHAFPGVEVRLAGAEGVEADEGEVQVRSVQVMLGYWNNPEATAEAFTPDGWFRTGDLAVRRPDGRYRIVGRLKEMFKSGGYNVYPREVEAVLEAHPGVQAAAVVGAPDPLWDEVGVAFVSGARPLDPDALKAWCRERLANYKVPKHVHVEAELPLLPIGKVDKAALRRRARGEPA